MTGQHSFPPFAALTGHEEAIQEKARLNEFKTDIEHVEDIDDLWDNYSEEFD